jgi:two-component system, chemotaxis family, chemotaxis protein CheY
MGPVGNEQGMALEAARGRALVVEDSDSVRAVLRQMLEEDSVYVVEARNGAEGLEQLRSDSAIGLVFLDMNMPDMNGLDVLRSIRADPTLAELPVVVLTGGSATAVVAAKDLGAAGWLQKPVRCEALVNVARSFLGHQKLDRFVQP